MTVKDNPQNNWFDFRKVNLEDLVLEQTSNNTNVALTNNAIMGSGILLDFPEEKVIFDSDSLSVEQSGWVSLGTFDGRGVADAAYTPSDPEEGNQIAVTISDARLDGAVNTVVTLFGKLFDNSLFYEHLEFKNNGTLVSKNHFKSVLNYAFQNFRGNNNTYVDGYGCFDVGGRCIISEASSYRISRDLVAAEQSRKPDMIFRSYKVYNPALTLENVVQDAIGASNDVDELDITTTVANTRSFEEGGTTETIYAQKFKMSGDNIQKVSLLLSLDSGSTWTGTLVIGIRPLMTSTSCSTDFLPDNEIDFDPDTVPLEEVALNQSQLEERGYVLTSEPQIVDFTFTESQISNPSLSNIEDGQFYVLTIRRTGSTATGTITLQEATNDSSEERLTVFSGSDWTDVSDSTLWYIVWSDSVKVSSGTAYDEGVRLPILKTRLDSSGVYEQNLITDLNLINTSEGAENYLIVEQDIEYFNEIVHPRTGDKIVSQKRDAPKFTMLQQDEVLVKIIENPSTVVLARVKDNNPRSNPEITGTITHPGAAIGNVINIINPPTDLLVQNVIGSTIIPNTTKTNIKYRITSQTVILDGYGDVDGDGNVELSDSTFLSDLDGYHVFAADTGTYTSAQQQALIASGALDILAVIRSDLNSDGYVDTTDINALSAFLSDGTAFPHGASEFTRVLLTVEPIVDPILSYNSTAISTLQVEVEDPDLIDPANFDFATGIDFRIDFVPVWYQEQIEVLDLRRYVNATFLDFSGDYLQSSVESGGQNNLFIAGDNYLSGNVKSLDGSWHPLDYEENIIELTLPSGNTEGEINIFDEYVAGTMYFSDRTLVGNSAINNGQVKFNVSVGSHVKNVSDYMDGYLDFDGYNDGYGSNADEVIGASIDHDTGLLRIRAFNIVENEFFPELRTKISVKVSLKKAGFANPTVEVDSTTLTAKLRQFAP